MYNLIEGQQTLTRSKQINNIRRIDAYAFGKLLAQIVRLVWSLVYHNAPFVQDGFESGPIKLNIVDSKSPFLFTNLPSLIC